MGERFGDCRDWDLALGQVPNRRTVVCSPWHNFSHHRTISASFSKFLMLTHQYPVHTVEQNMIVDIFNDKLPNQLCNELVNKYVGRAGESAEKENFLITIV